MRRILIGYDGSEHGDDALALGQAVADAAPGAEVVVASVYEQLSPRSARDDERPAQERERLAAEEILERARARWPELDGAALRTICANSPSRGLHRFAEEYGADVIVVGSSLVLVWVVELAVGFPVAFDFTGYVRDLHEVARSQMAAAAATLPEGKPVERREIEGRAEVELGEVDLDLDLLVIGSRGYGPIRRVLLGGVSTHVVRSAPCPVLVVPRPEPAAAAEEEAAVAAAAEGG